jgi:hypothetical protein
VDDELDLLELLEPQLLHKVQVMQVVQMLATLDEDEVHRQPDEVEDEERQVLVEMEHLILYQEVQLHMQVVEVDDIQLVQQVVQEDEELEKHTIHLIAQRVQQILVVDEVVYREPRQQQV